ncbi:MAG: BrnT family toxin [Bryobacteraceae bacterium]
MEHPYCQRNTTANQTAEWYNGYINLRFQFDEGKNREVKRKHGVSLEEAKEIFDQAHLMDRKNDDPEQFRAIGWSGGRLCSVIFEIRRDREGEFYHLITAWRATEQEEEAYANQI